MLDIRLIREKPDYVKAELAKCGVDPTEVDAIIETDARRRRLQHGLDELRAQRTRESRELGKASSEERERRRAEMRALGDRISTDERELTEAERQFEQLMLGMRNLPRPYVPVGKSEADNRIVRSEGQPTEFGVQTAAALGVGRAPGNHRLRTRSEALGHAVLRADGNGGAAGTGADRVDARSQDARAGLPRSDSAADGQ